MKINIKYKYKLLLLFLGVAFIAFGFLGDDKNGSAPPKALYRVTATQSSGKQGDAYGMNVNNIWLPINSKGIIADVNIAPNGSGGQYAGGTFLFSSGFFLSGYSNGTLWANACASATLVEDYLPGPVGQTGNSNAVVYVVNSADEPFGQSWQDWIDAVNLGADFYDGNCDGIYDPVDLNNNGKFDPESFPGACDGEDMPDLIGDEMVWCIYNDALPVAQRRWNTTIQVGVEVKQSVFGFASAGAIGNLIFVRYRILYKGLNESSPEELTDVYFGAWADPDVGDHTDDVIGVDTTRNAGYTYNNTPDAVYGNQVPCFMIDFFSGPRAYIAGVTYNDNNGDGRWTPDIEPFDTAIDTATSVQGQRKGIVYYPGAMNLPISSFVMYINGDPNLNDPSNKVEARNYMLGLNRIGNEPDPCTFAYGDVVGGVDCNLVDPRFWFSGDPVANNGTGLGWICTENRDMRQMTNTGPFTLEKDQQNEIVLAYVVGRGANPLDGITVARAIDDGAQTIFDANFLAPSPPPAPVVTLSSSDDFIDIMWETPDQVTYVNYQPSWDLKFEGYQVWAFQQNIPEDIVNGQPNSVLIASYDLDDFIENIYLENAQTEGKDLLYPVSPPENQLEYSTYDTSSTGRIRVRIYNDPFANNIKVTKGKPYYFAVTSYALNYNALRYKADPTVAVGTPGDYYLSSSSFAQEAENIRTIQSIVVGENALNPPVAVQPSNQVSGASMGQVGYDVINNSELTGDTYEVTFIKNDTSVAYSMFWNLTNITTGQVWDSSLAYTYGLTEINQPVTDGFITKIEIQNAAIGLPTYNPPGDLWYNYNNTPVDSLYARGIYYLGTDLIPTGELPYPFETSTLKQRSTFITSDKMRALEIRFGEEGVGKAYRFINGYKRYSPFKPPANTYPYAEAITSSDTTGRGPIGNWDVANNRPFGFVDVPFTVWVVDEQYDEEYQLAVGFMEAAKGSPNFPEGNPDGVWFPGTDARDNGEYLIIFDTPYDPNGNQIEITGGEFQTSSGTQTIWSDYARFWNDLPNVPADAQGITEEQRAIFDSPYLSTMYFFGLVQVDSTSWFTPGDVMTIPLTVYPYTDKDVYQFSTLDGTTLSSQDEQDLWNKVNVYPNPLYGYNELTSYYTNTPDEPYVTFTNLPEQITIKIFSLSGSLLRTLTTDDKSSPESPFLNWDLLNDSGLRVASGMYLAIVSSPKYGDKTLKFAIIMPQKQIQRY